MVGLIPLYACLVLDDENMHVLPEFKKRTEWFIQHRKDLTSKVSVFWVFFTICRSIDFSFFLWAKPCRVTLLIDLFLTGPSRRVNYGAPLLALHTALALTFICLLLESDQGAIASLLKSWQPPTAVRLVITNHEVLIIYHSIVVIITLLRWCLSSVPWWTYVGCTIKSVPPFSCSCKVSFIKQG